jgi:hypothetical protein
LVVIIPEPSCSARIDLIRREGQVVRWKIMRWKISGHGHDPRQIDLIAICLLLIAIIAAFHFYERNPQPPSKAAFIVPSQSVQW